MNNTTLLSVINFPFRGPSSAVVKKTTSFSKVPRIAPLTADCVGTIALGTDANQHLGTTAVPQSVKTTAVPKPLETTDVPQSLGTTAVRQSVRTTDVPQSLGTTAVPKSLGTTAVPQSLGTAAVLQSVGTTAVPQSVGTTAIPQPFGTTAVPQPLGTTAVPQYSETTDVPQSLGTTAVPQSVRTTAVPQSVGTTAVPQSLETTAVPQSLGTTAVPQSLTTAVPQSLGTAAVLQSVGTTAASKSVRTIAIHQPLGTTAVPQSSETTDVPQSLGTTAVPQSLRTTAFPRSLGTAAVLQSVGTTAAPQSVGTTAVPQSLGTAAVLQSVGTTAATKSVRTIAIPQPLGTTAVPQSLGTTAVLQSLGTTAAPQSVGTTAIPQPFGTTAVPQPLGTTAVPQSSETTAVPQSSETTVFPQSLGPTAVPQSLETTAVPQSLGSTDVSHSYSGEDLLRKYPEKPFLLLNVTETGVEIGTGSYGSVVEVDVDGTTYAAKRIHDALIKDTMITQFMKECTLLSTLRHPHIVQFHGICFLRGKWLPALVMERLMTNLHDLLESNCEASKPTVTLNLKCSILHNVASGLAYLHGHSPPIIHRDLTAKNILLNSAMVAKVADLGVARIMPSNRVVATMTKAPGTGVYMPPEALDMESSEETKTKYGTSIDVFSFGVVAIFTLSETFPSQLLQPNYYENEVLKARNELERRARYMNMITEQLYKEHPLIKMIEVCLNYMPQEWPNIHEVLNQLDKVSEVELMQDLHGKSNMQVNAKSMYIMAYKKCFHQNSEELSRVQKRQQALIRWV